MSVVAVVLCAGVVQAGKYQDYVQVLSPNYYFELNETSTENGVFDSISNTFMGSFNGDHDNAAGAESDPLGPPQIAVAGPDVVVDRGAWTFSTEWTELGDFVPVVGLGEGNLAHASNDRGHVNLGDSTLFSASAMTVSMFAKGGGNPQGGERLWTNNNPDPASSFQIVVGNDGIVVSVDPTVECAEGACGHKSLFLPNEGVPFSGSGADRGLIGPDNGWWHIVASTHGDTVQERVDNITLWLNGVNRTSDFLPGTTGWGTNDFGAKIGGRRGDPADSTTHSGSQDEVAVWLNRVLTDEEAANLFAAATDPNFVVPAPSNADFNGDGRVTGEDFLAWQAGYGLATGATKAQGDANGSGGVDGADYGVWAGQFGSAVSASVATAVPEPSTIALLGLSALAGLIRRRS